VARKFFSERNLKFLLYEVFDIEALTKYDYYRDHNRTVFEMVIKSAVKLAKDLLWPIFEEMDRNQPTLENGAVRVHPSVKKILKAFGEGGWISSTVPYNLDGEQLPHMIADSCQFIFFAANYSASVFPGLSDGAARLIEKFGDQYLYNTYVSKMRSGKWQGTMALTEPEAGSSLSDITTGAGPTGNGFYLITGQKIFISAGDHDGAENVIHLMLAKIKGAPAGAKGISLFVVPKKRLNDAGILISNDVVTSGVYHKLGYRGCPIVQLNIGDKNDCRGWLVGKPHNGLRYMFQMMNEARIGVGLGATSMATAAYYAALEYARTRRQGRILSQKDPSQPQVPIIEHADVKRMLLFQRSVVEGSLALLIQCSRYVDLKKVVGENKRDDYSLLLDLLTPIAKSFPSEMGIQAISQGLQCFGGSGYCDDYPMEQYYRDARIHPIHEGTTAIHGMDLLGRKITIQNGRAFLLFVDELQDTLSKAREIPGLVKYAQFLKDALEKLQNVTQHLLSLVQAEGPEPFLADATLYLELFGITTIAWQWLLQGLSAQRALDKGCKKSDARFYEGKMYTLRYFYAYELPKIKGLMERLLDDDRMTVEMDSDFFND
jgi:alkylation response protein AidB-like acyl-CoA dehydrogenase